MKPGLFLFLITVLGGTLSARAADWRPVNVPGPRSDDERTAVAAAGGFAWYRTWVKVDPSFFHPP